MNYRWSNPNGNHAVNRAERIRNRALHVEARRGRYANYWRLIALSLDQEAMRAIAAA